MNRRPEVAADFPTLTDSPAMPLWKRLLRLLAIIVLTPVTFLIGCQSRLIYHPRACTAEHEALLAEAKGRRIVFQTSQGRQTAYYIPPQAEGAAAPKTVWLCFGGNAALALEWLLFTATWNDRCGFLLVDYPGYGECEGRPTPGSVRESSTAAAKALAAELGLAETELRPRCRVLGHSLGCAAALMAANDLGVDRAVLVSPFTSMTDMGRIVLGWPLCLLNRHPFDNRAALGEFASRAGARGVIFHGTDDEIIPLRMGRELAEAHPDVLEFHPVAGAGHNDILSAIAGRLGRVMETLESAERPRAADAAR